MTWTCPTRNCRRTDEHDAKGCVVAWDARQGGEQCAAVLPNDTSMRFDDGYLNCALPAGHAVPHRTGYTGVAACEGHSAWTFDRAAIAALPSPYGHSPRFKP